MRVFISWSGERSHQVAVALRDWIPSVIQTVEPWISSADVEKGSRWSNEIARELANSSVGIICLTVENLTAPWLLFEAGALSKTLEASFVTPYLLDVQPADIGQPLGQFQATRANQTDTLKLLQTLNRALGDRALPIDRLQQSFEVWWPRLEARLGAIPPVAPILPQIERPDREVLEELLLLMRTQGRGIQDLHEQVSKLRTATVRETGAYVLSPALERLAEGEAFRQRVVALKKQLQAFQHLHAQDAEPARPQSLPDDDDLPF
jgi:hypothetical protein